MAQKKKKYNGVVVDTSKGYISEADFIKNGGNLQRELAPVKQIDISNEIAPVKSEEEKDWWETIVEKPKALDDGYDFGDITKTVLGTTADATLNTAEGIFRVGEGIAKLSAGLVAEGIDLFNGGESEYTQGIRKRISGEDGDMPMSRLMNWLEDKVGNYSIFGKTGDEVFSGIGYTLGMYEGGSALPGGGNVELAVGSHVARLPILSAIGGASSGLSEAYSKGATGVQAWEKALGSGAIESITESMFGFMGIGGNDITDEMAKKITSQFTSGTAQTLARLGISSTAEGMEEVISSAGNYFLNKMIDKVSKEDDPKFYEKWDWNQVGEEFATTFLSTALSGGYDSVTNINKMSNNAITNMEKEVGRELTVAEKKSVRDQVTRALANDNTLNETRVLDSEMESRLAELGEYTNKDRARIRRELNQDLANGRISIDAINKALPGITEQWSQQFSELKELQEEIQNSEGAERDNLIKEYQQKLQEYQQDERLRGSFVEEYNKGQTFKYEANEKMSDLAKTTYQSAVDSGMDNTKATHDLIDFASKMAEYTGVNIKFATNEQLRGLKEIAQNLSQNEDVFVNGAKVNSENTIYINSQSNKNLYTILGHELGHLLDDMNEGKKIRDFARKYADSKGEYSDRYTKLSKNYDQSEISTEMANDIIGEYLFTDENFVTQLATENPSTFKKIYDWFQHIFNLAKAGSKEARQLEQVRYNLEKGLEKINEKGTDKNVTTKETKFLLSENAYNDVKDIIDLTQKEAEKDKRQFVKLKDNTTPQLVELGAEDLPMLERAGHVRENILTEEEAKKLGFSIKDKHFHGLGIDTYLNIIDSMEDATNIYQYTNNEKHFIIETPVEINGVKSLVPVFLKREGLYNNVSIDYNRIRTVFAPQNDYINTLLKEGKIKKTVTDVSRQQSPSMANNIPQNEKKVNKNDIKYSLSEQLEKNLEKTVFNAEKERQGMIDLFNSYLEENDITNPTQEDIDNSLDTYDLMDANDEGENLNKVRDKYTKTIQEYLKSQNTDSEGKILSSEQKNFFKNSKVRDDEGKLLRVYHGTDATFTVFDRGNGEHGAGFYFTDDYDYAEEYTNNRDYNDSEDGGVMESYLNLVNPLDSSIDFNNKSMQKFINKIENKWGLSREEILECFKDNNMYWSSELSSKVAEKMGYGIDDVIGAIGFEIQSPDDIGIADYNAYLGAYAWENGLNELARECGFDGIISMIYNSDTEGFEYIAFNPNQIKDINNANPTTNNDIRFSIEDLSEEEKSPIAMTQKKDGTKVVKQEDIGLNDRELEEVFGKQINKEYDKAMKDAENVKFSLDSDGRELSKEQQEFFKDSKIRDEDGRLLTLYHGTPNGEFTIFRPGSYFSSNKDYAKGYEWTGASSISSGKTETKLNTYEVYLNITNPFTLNNPTAKQIYIDEYIKGGNSLYLDPYSDYTDYINNLEEIDWTEGEDLKEWLQKNHKEYDGLILDEGGDGGYGEAEYRWRGLSYVPFNSNQIKNVDNKNPTSNEDIRFSLSKNESDTDSKGRKLTKKQQDFFKDSEIRDENGRLLAVYHGTMYGDFNEFKGKDAYFFTTKEKFADDYARQKEFDFEYDMAEHRIMELYLKATNLFDSQNEEKISQLRDALPDKVNFWGNVMDKDTYIERLQGKYDLPGKWTQEKLANAEFGSFLGDDRNGYCNDVFVGLDGNDITYIKQIDNDYIKNLTDEEKVRVQKELMENGKVDLEEIYTPWGYMTKNALEKLTQEYRNQGNEYGLEMLEENQSVYDWKTKTITAYKDRADVQHLTGQDNWNYIESSFTRDENGKTKDIIDYIRDLKFDAVKITEDGVENYMVFNANQIKNIDNKNPTDSNDIRYSLSNEEELAPTKESYPKSFEPYYEFAKEQGFLDDDERMMIFNGTGKEDKSSLKDKVTKPRDEFRKSQPITPEKSQMKKTLDLLDYMFVNRNSEIDNLARDSGNANIKYLGDMLNGVSGEAQNEITYGQTNNQGERIGKSINELFDWANNSGLSDAFNDYLLHYSNIDRHEMGKGSRVHKETSEKMVRKYEKAHPEFKQHAEEVWNFSKNVRDNLLEAGVINQGTYDYLSEAYPHYVPYMEQRDITQYIDDSGKLKPVSTIKTAKGGATHSALTPVQEALTKYIYNEKKQVRQNDLYREIFNTIEGEKMLIGADDGTEYMNDNYTGLYRDENGNYLTARFDGEVNAIKISDDLYNQLNKTMERQIKELEQNLSLITKPVQTLSNIRRNLLTTWSPSFLLKNPIKDFGDAVINSTDTKAFIKNYLPAYGELMKDTELARQFKALYGSGNAMGEYESESGLSTGKKVAKTGKGILQKIANFNEIVELAPRFAEFKSTIERGGSVQEAMYNAREVTINFNRGGVITKAMNRNGFTFLNASVQGFDKFIRNFSGQNGAIGVVGALMKATTFGVLPALFNHLIYAGGDEPDEEYEALPDYIKDNYYLIKGDNGTWIRIPKGRIPAVFGMVGRRTLEYAQGEEDAFDGMTGSIYDQVGFDPFNNHILAPIQQAYWSGENGRAWYGGDLVPTRLQDKPAGEQYDESTDAISKWIGSKFGISPYKLNYVLDQYTGGMGDMFLPMITEEASSDAETLPEYMIAPVKDQFIIDSTMDNKYAGEFYQTKEDFTIKSNSAYATDEDTLKSKYLSSVSSELSKLYQEKREVQSDTSLSKKQKYEKVKAIQDEINKLAKEGLDNYQNLNKTNTYAIIGDREYYKDGNEWKNVNDDELEQLNLLGLDLNEKTSYFNSKGDIASITEDYKEALNEASDEEKEVLNRQKKLEIIDVIKNSNLSDEAKAYLYTKHYGDYATVNALNSLGISMNDYLELESQNFTSDKYANGKIITNSKKKKVMNYINSMNLTAEQKIILAKLKYPSTKMYNSRIIKYLQDTNYLDYDEKLLLLKKLGFKVENNKISW